MTDDIAHTYNTFLYDSLAIKQTHPLHLYAIARLCGLAATPPATAKVLELGCASGGNLIPMAYHLPTTQFLGIDLAQKQIEKGLAVIQDLQLNNIQLKHQSILDFHSNEPFDYIICHGLFSWVPEEVREKVFAICQQYLTKNGVAYISYNTFPGWQIGNIVRELLEWQTRDILDPYQKVSIARQTLKDLQRDLNQENTAYAQLLQAEALLIDEHSDNQLLHEHLSPYHYPLSLSEFMIQASRYQLMYLSDAFLSNDETALSQKDGLITALQKLDILKNRRFRCTLLCHQQEQLFEKPPSQDNFQMSFPINEAITIDKKPIICSLVRYQAAEGETVTNHRHENISLTPVAQMLIPFLDGTHDLASLVEIVAHEVEQGSLILVNKQGQEIQERQARYQYVSQICEETIQLLAKNALLLDARLLR